MVKPKGKNAIILCSGGLDSAVVSYYVKKRLNYGKIIILFFDYNQRTLKQERTASKKIAKETRGEFREIRLPELHKISLSLINKKKKVKKVKRKQLKDTKKECEKYYVPCRNIVFLIHALALAESFYIKDKEIYDLFTGFKCEGKEAYPDTTPEFVKQMNKLREISTGVKGKIIAPLIKKDKDEIIRLGEKLGVKFRDTFSCYVGGDNLIEHCGYCLSCRLRQEAFYWMNLKDPTRYKIKMKDYREAKAK